MKERTLTERNKELGNKLAIMRFNLNLSQEELAEKLQLAGLDVSRVTLSKIELGKRQLYVTELPAFAQVYKLNVSEFVNKLFN